MVHQKHCKSTIFRLKKKLFLAKVRGGRDFFSIQPSSYKRKKKLEMDGSGFIWSQKEGGESWVVAFLVGGNEEFRSEEEEYSRDLCCSPLSLGKHPSWLGNRCLWVTSEMRSPGSLLEPSEGALLGLQRWKDSFCTEEDSHFQLLQPRAGSLSEAQGYPPESSSPASSIRNLEEIK